MRSSQMKLLFISVQDMLMCISLIVVSIDVIEKDEGVFALANTLKVIGVSLFDTVTEITVDNGVNCLL